MVSSLGEVPLMCGRLTFLAEVNHWPWLSQSSCVMTPKSKNTYAQSELSYRRIAIEEDKLRTKLAVYSAPSFSYLSGLLYPVGTAPNWP